MRTNLLQKFSNQNPNIDDHTILDQIMSFYTNKQFHKVVSAKSGKEIISVYPPDTLCKVYTHAEWYSDDCIPATQDIDYTRAFFDQFQKLLHTSPVVSLLSNLQENSEYCHDVEGMKNCYYCFDGLESADSYYCYRIHYCTSCVDCYSIYHSENLYGCVDMERSYTTKYSYHCQDVSNSYFLINCKNVQNSFMCSNLDNKQYCIYNKQHTKEEYEQFMSTIQFNDYTQILKLKKNFYEDLLKETNVPTVFLENCEHATGNHLRNSSSVERVFESWDMKDAYNCFQCSKGHDVIHSFMCCENVELCNQCVATGIGVYKTSNCAFTRHSTHMEYCYLCLNCNHCFGCVGLRNREYCIFNKQYTKEQYEQEKTKLIEYMNTTGEYGKFFPKEISPFRYEDTIASDLFSHEYDHIFNKELTSYTENYLPKTDSIRTCLISKKDYLLTAQEVLFYNKHQIPYPRVSFQMRHKERLELMNTNLQL